MRGTGPGELRVFNRTRETVLGDQVREADSFVSRLAGLIGTRDLPAGRGLWIRPCRGVHTFGMRYPIDVAYLGRGRLVLRIRPALQPNRIGGYCPTARSILELPAGTLRRTGTVPGDRLEFLAASGRLTTGGPRW
jgi:uncharacterized protein